MKFQQEHSLSKEEAKKRLEALTSYWAKYGVEVKWEGDSARFSGKVKGVHVDASMTVKDRLIDGEGSDPGLLMRTAATAYIKRKLAEYLDPKKTDADVARIDA